MNKTFPEGLDSFGNGLSNTMYKVKQKIINCQQSKSSKSKRSRSRSSKYLKQAGPTIKDDDNSISASTSNVNFKFKPENCINDVSSSHENDCPETVMTDSWCFRRQKNNGLASFGDVFFDVNESRVEALLSDVVIRPDF